MKKILFAATLVCLGLSATPGFAQVNSASGLVAQQAAPQIDSFSVEPVDQLNPGSELVFTLQGTPNAQATLTVGNVANLPMREIEPGIYQGRYTIRSSDQISENTAVRANLSQGDQISSVRLQDSLIAGANGSNTTSSNTTNSNNRSAEIQSFTAQSVENLDPGTELSFTLVGTPDAEATFSIEGVALNQPMQEVRPGTYEGSYVIRRQDYFPAAGTNVTAQLDASGQIVRARLDQQLVADGSTGSTSSSSQLPLEILSPSNNSRVDGTIEVTGRSAPQTTINVNVKATNSLAGIVGINRDVLSREVQTDAQGNFSFEFEPAVGISGTRYEISLSADNGNQTNQETLVLIQQ